MIGARPAFMTVAQARSYSRNSGETRWEREM